MSVVREHLKVLIGIGLTWACVFIFFNGMAHATLDGWTLVFPVFQPGNLLLLMSAPIAQSSFYILARKTSWLLNTYLVISLIGCAVAWLHLTDGRYAYGGYHYTYWHQGDLLCKSDGCNDVLFFGYLIFMQGLILVFVPSVLEVFPVFLRGMLKIVLIAVLLWLALTSFALTISM